MAGLGAGRRNRYARKTNELPSIDLADLRRWGVLKGMQTGTLRWSRGDIETGSVRYHSGEDGFQLIYRTRDSELDEWREVRETIHWDFTDQPIGGRRRWFLCPGCQTRARILYGGSHFRCRKCYRAVYECQYSRFPDRAANKALRLRQKLGCDSGIESPIPSKPKGMHWKTYWRLYDDILEAESDLAYGFANAVKQLSN